MPMRRVDALMLAIFTVLTIVLAVYILSDLGTVQPNVLLILNDKQ